MRISSTVVPELELPCKGHTYIYVVKEEKSSYNYHLHTFPRTLGQILLDFMRVLDGQVLAPLYKSTGR